MKNKLKDLRKKQGSFSSNSIDLIMSKIMLLLMITTFGVSFVMGKFNIKESELVPKSASVREQSYRYFFNDYKLAAKDFNRIYQEYFISPVLNEEQLTKDFAIISSDCDEVVTIEDVMNAIADMSIVMDAESQEIMNNPIDVYTAREKQRIIRADALSLVYSLYINNPSQITEELVSCRMGFLCAANMNDVQQNILRIKRIGEKIFGEKADEESRSTIKLFNILLLAKTVALANEIEYHMAYGTDNEYYWSLSLIQECIDNIISSGEYNNLLSSAVLEINKDKVKLVNTIDYK